MTHDYYLNEIIKEALYGLYHSDVITAEELAKLLQEYEKAV